MMVIICNKSFDLFVSITIRIGNVRRIAQPSVDVEQAGLPASLVVVNRGDIQKASHGHGHPVWTASVALRERITRQWRKRMTHVQNLE